MNKLYHFWLVITSIVNNNSQTALLCDSYEEALAMACIWDYYLPLFTLCLANKLKMIVRSLFLFAQPHLESLFNRGKEKKKQFSIFHDFSSFVIGYSASFLADDSRMS